MNDLEDRYLVSIDPGWIDIHITFDIIEETEFSIKNWLGQAWMEHWTLVQRRVADSCVSYHVCSAANAGAYLCKHPKARMRRKKKCSSHYQVVLYKFFQDFHHRRRYYKF